MTDQIETHQVSVVVPKPRASRKATEPTEETLPRDIGTIIPLIREELGAIAKGQETEVGTRYKYRGHDEIINAIVPLMNKYGVYTTVEDELLKYKGRPAANNKWNTAAIISKRVTFWAPDGSSRTSTIVAESTDNGNKSVSQAQTYAERFAYTQTFTIPTGDADPDANAEDAPGAPTAEPAPSRTQPAAPVTAAESDEIVGLRDSIKAHLKEHGIEGKDPVLGAGLKFFNGREGFWENRGALTKWEKALKSGEIPEVAS